MKNELFNAFRGTLKSPKSKMGSSGRVFDAFECCMYKRVCHGEISPAVAVKAESFSWSDFQSCEKISKERGWLKLNVYANAIGRDAVLCIME